MTKSSRAVGIGEKVFDSVAMPEAKILMGPPFSLRPIAGGSLRLEQSDPDSLLSRPHRTPRLAATSYKSMEKRSSTRRYHGQECSHPAPTAAALCYAQVHHPRNNTARQCPDVEP